MGISFKTEKKPNEKHNILMSQLYERVHTILYMYTYVYNVRNTGNYRRVIAGAALHTSTYVFFYTHRARVYFHYIIIIG